VIGGAYAAPALSDALDPLAGVERSFATDLVYGTLRWLPYLDAALAPRLREPDMLPQDVRDALRLGAWEKLIKGTPPYALVDAWVEIVKGRWPKLAPLANAVLRRVDAPPNPTHAERVALPPWLFEAFEAALGDDATRAAEGMLRPEPLWLTVHRAGAAEVLAEDGADVEDGPVPHTLRVRLPVPLGATRAFREGWVQPQNPASSLPTRWLDARPGERVLDLASGRGIKSAQLASAGARVVAVESSRRRSRQAEANLRRLGLDAEHVVADLASVPDLDPARRVLLDAPCTGTGTLRGHPEIKLRVTPEDVASLADLQRRLLDTAAALTLPGGRLVYAVCSLTRAEGEDQVAAFVQRHPAFSSRPLRPSVPHRPTPHGVYVLPVEGLDGFFVSVLEHGVAGDATRV
jgi:16S rRNA (cytosine967-C5)-methyltransferase